jgi:hypothetical protein
MYDPDAVEIDEEMSCRALFEIGLEESSLPFNFS